MTHQNLGCTVSRGQYTPRHFLAALDPPFQPNPTLQEAMNRAASLTR